MLSGSFDKTLKLWDVASGKLLKTFEGHGGGGGAFSVAFAPDGRTVLSVAFVPDGRTVLSGSSEHKLWDVASGKLLQTFEEHGGHVSSVAFAPDGRTALGSYDKTLKLWDGRER